MANENPYWYKLIEYKRIVKHETGYTLPFIIGAHSYSGRTDEFDIGKLIDEINEYKTSEQFLISSCSTTGNHYILSIATSDDISASKITDKIIFHNDEIGYCTLSDKAIALLNREYNPVIAIGKYSWVNENWEPFTPEDILEIKEALK